MQRLLPFILLFLAACTRAGLPGHKHEVTFILTTGGTTRAAGPDENTVKDFNLLVFNAWGELEEQVYVSARELKAQGGVPRCTLPLLKDVPYTFVATANTGYRLGVTNLAEARAFRHHLAYPDEYGPGIPMAVVRDEIRAGEQVELRLERLMARIDLQTDRRALPEGVSIKVTEVEVEACPTWVMLFPGSRPLSRADVFLQGLRLSGSDVDPLNREEEGTGLSGVLSLYVLENCQGDEPGTGVSTRVTVRTEYHSDAYHTEAGETLSYRFYPQENRFDLERNTVYPVVLRWEGEGMPTEGPEGTFSGSRSSTGW